MENAKNAELTVAIEDLLNACKILPNGKEKIGKGHIICTLFWWEAHSKNPKLSFKDFAARHCNEKPSKAFVSVWDGTHCATFTESEVMTAQDQERVSAELDKFFNLNGIKTVLTKTI